MALQNDRLLVFIACCSRRDHDDIIQIVLIVLQTVLLCKIYQIITDLFLFVGGMRDITDLLKIVKYLFRL